MKPGDIVLVRFPQADLQTGKLRPALVLALAPGRHSDALLAMRTAHQKEVARKQLELGGPAVLIRE